MNEKNTTNNVWQQKGDSYWPSNTALDVRKIPPGIYSYGATPNGQWFLELTTSRYVFPYKIYGAHDRIIDRVKRAWKSLPSNLGVLLNGLKGTGKTITAQQIVNWAIDEGLVVLNAQSPVPLAMIMEHVEQPMLVLFDEFEKTHAEDKYPGSQQQLLSAIDGLSKNEHRRLFLFTTNTKKVDENLVDRPSRIRYGWEFGRLSSDLIEMLLDDMLDKELARLRPEILTYLNTRAVLTIDVVKAVIFECNTFREGPEAFKSILNLSEKEPGGFKVEIIDELGMTVEVAPWFKTQQGAWLLSMMSKHGRQTFIETFCRHDTTQMIHSTMGQTITVIGPTDRDDEWICNVQLPVFKTWISGKLEREAGRFLWLDEQPKGWKVPEWARKVEAGTSLSEVENDAYDSWMNSGHVYGGNRTLKVRVRFTLDNSSYTYDHRAMFSRD